MKHLRLFLVFLILQLIPFPLSAENSANNEKLNIPEIVLEHLSDSYEWHIATFGNTSISIPLPIILRSSLSGNWTICTLHSLPDNYYVDTQRHGKIYEKTADGSSKKPLDLSFTKTVAQIWIVVVVLIGIFLSCAHWYKSRNEQSNAPGGFVGLMEMLVMSIYNDVVKASIGEKHFRPYAPYLLTVFFFIFTCNLLGLLPIFPGGANVTGNINITFFLAFCSMVAINLFGNKEYWKDIFWPKVPVFLKAYPVPLMPVIEFFGVFTKPFALMVRLFANMMAGHAIILSFTCVIFLGWSMGLAYGLGLNFISIVMMLFMNCLELLVAFIQAYVFTLLSAVFIGLAHKEETAEE